jgi:hypothetical protein
MVADFANRHDRESCGKSACEAFEQSPSRGRVGGRRCREFPLHAIHEDDERRNNRDARDHQKDRVTHLTLEWPF